MAWLNTNYAHRKQVNITGQSGAGTDYQQLLKVGASSSATGADFHLEGHSAAFPTGKDDGGDLAFTASDQTTEIPFWVEKITGSGSTAIAYVWVKVSADLGSNQSVYCYYANASATNKSNGGNTFPVFDDFAGGSLDTSKWNSAEVRGSTGVSVGSSLITFTPSGSSGDGAKIMHKTDLAMRGYAMHARMQMNWNGTTSQQEFMTMGFCNSDQGVVIYGQAGTSSNSRKNATLMIPMAASGAPTGYRRVDFEAGDASNSYEPGTNNISAITADTLYDVVYKQDYANLLMKADFNGSSYTSGAVNSGVFSSMANMRAYFGAGEWNGLSSGNTKYDYLFVRKWQATEPAFSTSGSEENSATTYNQNVIATTVVSGKVIKQVPKTLIATSTISGSVIKQLTRSLIATTAITGKVIKQLSKTLIGNVAVSASMVATKVFLQTLTATTAITASITKIPGKLLTSTTAVSASIAKQLTLVRTLTATTAVSGVITKQMSKTLTAAAAVSAAITKTPGKLLTATTAVSAAITKQAGKLLTATTHVSASIIAGRAVIMIATTAVGATITKTPQKLLQAIITIRAIVRAPFWKTKYPSHEDGGDYEVKYPHD